jgi:hypothetical protein
LYNQQALQLFSTAFFVILKGCGEHEKADNGGVGLTFAACEE